MNRQDRGNKTKRVYLEQGRRVYVGLSGGVDSSVSAALLKVAGFDVTGVFIKVWTPPFYECTWKEDRLDAMRVCAKLSIPFVTLDLEKEYKKEVVDYMLAEYKAGRTPNPDVMCNKHVKFGAFFDWAMKEGADFVATGHYAQIAKREAQNVKRQIRKKKDSLSLHATRYILYMATDANKDQSYFLWTLGQKQLSKTLFPVGGLQKPEVRKLAKKFDLITATKKDSQGLCFIGKVDMKEFLGHYIKPKKGNVLNQKGEIIGEHDGAIFYTFGERLSLTRKNREQTRKTSLDQGPYYVVAKDVKKNTVTVAHKFPNGSLPNSVKEVVIKDCNWALGSAPSLEKTYYARCRYRQSLEKCTIEATSDPRSFRVHFAKTQSSVTPGQSLVLYDKEVCLGGGILV